MENMLLWVAAVGAVLTLVVSLYVALRGRGGAGEQRALLDALERSGRGMREELANSQRDTRNELAESQRGLRAEVTEAMRALGVGLTQSHEDLRTALTRDAREARAEHNDALGRFATQFGQRLQGLVELNDRRMGEVKQTVDERLKALQADNGQRLEAMQHTVDEKLHATLEARLGESFRLVSERLEAVHKGLGEMQSLAAGVGDLKRVLTNVKSRGTWGEVQLARLIEDTMTPEQYGRNVKPVPGSDAIVEFAIRLPGRGEESEPVWLPIDAKFPKEEYERLVDAQEAGDAEAARIASTALARAVELQAKNITKYVAPPHTTDFAIMFLPTEGLYAEVLRVPGLSDKLQALRVSVAGPSNLAAMLNSLQMGFRTLAIEQRSSEVWQVLRAVKTEFGRFGESLASVKKSLDQASNKIGQTEVRTRAMLRNLREVEALPEGESSTLLGSEETGETPADDETV